MNDPITEASYQACVLCPRMCGIDRSITTGFCRCGTAVTAARAALHYWEEPCISGVNGSGTVFFSGCTLNCCFCQNYTISQEHTGKEITPRRLADIFLRLQEQGAHNLNLVTATQYLPGILKALDLVKHRLNLPIVYNSGGYERLETIDALNGYIDIYLPDLKYWDRSLSAAYSGAADYFDYASSAILSMIRQTGPPKLMTFSESCTLMSSGVILRHMVLPGAKEDSIRLLHWIHDCLPKGHYYISLLSQYTPYRFDSSHPELNRRITTYEYQKVIDTAWALGLDQGFMQQKSSAKEEYTPPFDLEGIDPPP